MCRRLGEESSCVSQSILTVADPGEKEPGEISLACVEGARDQLFEELSRRAVILLLHANLRETKSRF